MKHAVLAKKDGLGQVVTCSSCADIHLIINNLTIKLSRSEFAALAGMLQDALVGDLVRSGRVEWKGPALFSRA